MIDLTTVLEWLSFFFLTEFCCVLMQVYNDADILEKILKDKRKELGSPPEEDDVGSPKVKLSMSDLRFVYVRVSADLLNIR